MRKHGFLPTPFCILTKITTAEGHPQRFLSEGIQSDDGIHLDGHLASAIEAGMSVFVHQRFGLKRTGETSPSPKASTVHKFRHGHECVVIVSSIFRTMYGYRARTWAGTGSVCSSYAPS